MAGRLRRVAHPLRVAGFVLLVIALVVGAFVVGRSVKDPDDEALQAAKQHLEVYSTAERRVVDAGHSWQGEVHAGDEADVALAGAKDGRAVVTRQTVKIGDELKPGDLVAVVSGRPRILIPSSIPLYRDLRTEDRGDDVAALQAFLGTLDLYHLDPDGRFDWATEQALRELFKGHGFTLPTETTTVTTTPTPSGEQSTPAGEQSTSSGDPTVVERHTTVVRWQEFVQTPNDGGIVVDVAATATVLVDKFVLCRVRVSDPSARFILPVDDEGVLSKGQKVTASGAGGDLETTVVSVGKFGPATENQPIAGFPVVVRLPADSKFRVGSPVRISVPNAQGEEQLAVPTVAVKQGAQGPYVSVRTDHGRVDVKVTILAQQGGWTAIEPDDAELLAVGSEVLVS